MHEMKSVQDVCCLINDRASRLTTEGSARERARLAALAQINQGGISPGFIPSGPRKRGEGCDDENQGIVAADETPSGGARLRITLLAAGFIIGPSGASIRAVSHKSGAEIRSWSETFSVGTRSRRVRTICIEGQQRCVVAALGVIVDAVERYKQLCEGKFCGKMVDRVQVIRGVEFFYSPPPRSAVPYAAALKPELLATATGATSPSLGLSISPGATTAVSPGFMHSSGGAAVVSPTALAQKENFAAAVAAAATASAVSPGMAKQPLGSASPRKPTLASITESHLNARAFNPSGLGLGGSGAGGVGSTAEETAEELEGGGGGGGDIDASVYGSGSLDLGGGRGSALAAALAGVEAQALMNASMGHGYASMQPPPPPPPPTPVDMSLSGLAGFYNGAAGSYLPGGAFLPNYGHQQQPPIASGPLFGTMLGPLGYKPPPPTDPHPADLAAAEAAAQAVAAATAAQAQGVLGGFMPFGGDTASYPFGPALLAGIWGNTGGGGVGGGTETVAAEGQGGVIDAQLRAAVFNGYDLFAAGTPFYNGMGPGMDEEAAARRPAVQVKANTQGILRSAFEPEGDSQNQE